MILRHARHLLLAAGAVFSIVSLVGCGGGGSKPTDGGNTELPSVRVLSLPVGAMTYDENKHMIYVSVPNTGDSRSNTVTAVDPVAGTVGESVFVGSNPGLIVVSDDGQYVYVAVDGGIRRVDTSSMTADMMIDPGHDGTRGQYMVEDLEFVPGRPEAVAATLRSYSISPAFVGAVIYENGQCLPDSLSVYNGFPEGPNLIEFGPSNVLYGYDKDISNYLFYKMQAGASGLTVTDCFGAPWHGNRDFAYHNGRLYISTGEVYNADTMSMVGKFSTGGLIIPDSARNKMYIMDDYHELCVFNLNTFVFLDQVNITDVKGNLTSCIEWGDKGIAIGTSGGQLALVDASKVLEKPGGQPGRPLSMNTSY